MDAVDHIYTELQNMQTRQMNYEETVKTIAEPIQRNETRVINRIIEKHHTVTQILTQPDDSLKWDQMQQSIHHELNELEQFVAREQAVISHSINEISDQISSTVQSLDGLRGRLDREEQSKQQTASTWLQAAVAIFDFVQKNYAHEFFSPGSIQDLEEEIIQADQNLVDGFSEASLVTAQRLYRAVSNLRLHLENAEWSWRLLANGVYQGACTLVNQLNQNQFVNAVGMDGEFLDEKIDVDYWSNGQLSNLLEEIAIVIQKLQEDDPPDMYTLEQWMIQWLPAQQAALERIVYQARMAVLDSQFRLNIADRVVNALQHQGFSLEDGEYVNRDMRNPFFAKVKNLEGSEVFIKVSPVPGTFFKDELHLVSQDKGQRTEHELHHRAQEVMRSLRTQGLQVGKMAVQKREKDSRYPAINIAQRQATNTVLQE